MIKGVGDVTSINIDILDSGKTITACRMNGIVPESHEAGDFNLYVRTVGSTVIVSRSDTDETIVKAVGFAAAMTSLANHYGLPVTVALDYGVADNAVTRKLTGTYEPTTVHAAVVLVTGERVSAGDLITVEPSESGSVSVDDIPVWEITAITRKGMVVRDIRTGQRSNRGGGYVGSEEGSDERYYRGCIVTKYVPVVPVVGDVYRNVDTGSLRTVTSVDGDTFTFDNSLMNTASLDMWVRGGSLVKVDQPAPVAPVAEAVSDWRNGPRVIEYPTTGQAYDASQTDDTITDGTVFIVRSERVVGVLVLNGWPLAVTPENGCFAKLSCPVAEFAEGAYVKPYEHAVKLADAMGFMVPVAPVAPVDWRDAVDEAAARDMRQVAERRARMLLTDEDMFHRVNGYISGSGFDPSGWDVAGIVDMLREQFGTVSLDTIPSASLVAALSANDRTLSEGLSAPVKVSMVKLSAPTAFRLNRGKRKAARRARRSMKGGC